jgi:hypothetical protein
VQAKVTAGDRDFSTRTLFGLFDGNEGVGAGAVTNNAGLFPVNTPFIIGVSTAFLLKSVS